ncbi:MAG TPA: Type 1 glutamine amidotransferase-like domain-containing protein [Thermoanaerobaculia bacterium]
MIRRLEGAGWLALLGGGEFSFGETLDADRAWLAKAPPGPIGFVPAASGSADYGVHLAEYFEGSFGRAVETIPIYRPRDARRGRNAERIAAVAAVYLGGGVTDHLLEALAGSPAAEALAGKLRDGGVVAAIAAAAQCAGRVARSIFGGGTVPGLGWLPDAAVEPNFDPGHDRRLRKLMAAPGVEVGLGIPAGAALLLGPEGAVEVAGTAFRLRGADGDLEVMA